MIRTGSRASAAARAAAPALVLAVALLLPASAARAQLETVSLQLRPRAGEVFRTRLDQLVEVTGTMKHGRQDTTVTVRTDLLVLTRSRIVDADRRGATVLAITDSVLLFTTGSSDAWTDQTMRRMRGQRLRMHLAPDGAVSVSEADGDNGELKALVTQMPALLPREAVSVGSTWSRSMAMPLAGQPDARLGAQVAATFRLDSLVGDLAWISMSGTLQPAKRRDGDALPTELAGTVNGHVVVDRRRGWIVDARTVLAVRSAVGGSKGAAPMKFRMRIDQRMRAW